MSIKIFFEGISPCETMQTEQFQRLTLKQKEEQEENFQFPRKPEAGRAGKGVQVLTNYFQMTNFPSTDIVQYDIHIHPEVPPNLNRYLFF